MTEPNNTRTKRLALGTVQFGLPYGIANTSGQVPLPEAERMVRFAAEAGIDTIDTAIGYGDSERVLGRIGVTQFKVVSKIPPLAGDVGNVADWIRHEIDRCFDNLKVDCLHALLLHRPTDLLGHHGHALAAVMNELKADGKVKRIGVSIYAPDNIENFAQKIPLDLIQAPVNLFDTRLLDSGWLQRLKLHGCEIHVRSAFLQGLLLMPQAAIPDRFAQWAAIFSRWHDWLREHHASPLAACLAFPLSVPAIDRVVVGANNLAQLKEIICAVERDVAAILPNLACGDEDLINPARWPDL